MTRGDRIKSLPLRLTKERFVLYSKQRQSFKTLTCCQIGREKEGNLGKCVHCPVCHSRTEGFVRRAEGGRCFFWVGSSPYSSPHSLNLSLPPPPPLLYPRLLPFFIRGFAAPTASQGLGAVERHMVRTAALRRTTTKL